MPTPNPAAQPTLDGRTARAARTREAVVRALLGLIAEGDLRPTAGRIAERAGISLRSVYVHFDDLDDLFVAASHEQRARVAEIVRALPTDGPFATRLGAFVEQRARVLEAVAPVAKATALQASTSPALAAASQWARRQGRAELEQVFEIELAVYDRIERVQMLDACDALTNSEAWDQLRARRGLTPRAAAATLSAALTRLLQPEVTPSPPSLVRRWRARTPPVDGPGAEERT